MIKHTLIIAIGLTAATPALAGQAESAVSVCKAAAAQAGATNMKIRSIDPSGKQTRVKIAVRDGEARTFDCRVDYRGEIMLAEFDRPAATQSAAR